MKNGFLVIAKKELVRFFRDRRMVLTTVLLPGILIYVLYSFMGSGMETLFAPDEETPSLVYAENVPDSLSVPLAASGLQFAEEAPDKDTVKKAVTEGTYDAAIYFDPDFDAKVEACLTDPQASRPYVQVYYNTAETDSQPAYTVLMALLDGYESVINPSVLQVNPPIKDEVYDLATDEDMSAQIFSMMLPMLLMMMIFSGCVAVAPESIAGEKERGTIATLLVTPLARRQLALGKIVSLSMIALLSGASSFIGIMLSLPKLMGGDVNGMTLSMYGAEDYLCLLGVILATVLLIVAMVAVVSAFAKSVKEATTYISPMMIAVVVLGVTTMFSGDVRPLFVYLIPLYNSVCCIHDVFACNLQPWGVLMTVGANLVACGGFVYLLTRMFNSEKMMFRK